MQQITPFEQKMRLVFGLAFAVLFSTIAVSVFVINRLNESAMWVVHTHDVIARINAVHVSFGDARVSTKNYLLTRRGRHLAPRVNSMLRIDEGMANLKAMTADNRSQQKIIDEIAAALRAYFKLTAEIITEVDNTKDVSFEKFAEWTDKTEPAGHAVSSCLTRLKQEEERLLVEREKVANSFVNQAYGIMPFMLAVQLVIILYIYYGVLHRCDSY